jgi:ABC-2 type transport system permease protein
VSGPVGGVARWYRYGPAVAVHTAIAYTLRCYRYRLNLVQENLQPVLLFVTMAVTYDAAGRDRVAGADARGFLVVGVTGVLIWSSTVWASGFAIERERGEGTIGSLFLTPASRSAVIVGYSLGVVVRFLPALVTVGLLIRVTGARLLVTDPLAAAVTLSTLVLSCVCVGYALASVFVLSRRGHVLATLLSYPMWLLTGLLVPRAELPAVLSQCSRLVPVSFAVDAVQAAALTGRSLQAVLPATASALLMSGAYVLFGRMMLALVERYAKHHATLELY